MRKFPWFLDLRIIVLVLILTILSACNPSEKDEFAWGSLSGNGKQFSYTRKVNGLSSIFISDRFGNEIQKIMQSGKHVLGGKFIGSDFYHISYEDGKIETDASTSKIYKCKLTEYNCKEIYSARGSIICIFKLNKRILFFHSKSWEKDDRGRSYYNFVIRSIGKDGGVSITEFGRGFVTNMCPVVFEGSAYASISFPFDSDMQIIGNDPFVRSDHIISLVDGRIEISQVALTPRGSANILMYIPDLNLGYLGMDRGNGYIYGNCINLSKCQIAEKQTNPVIIGSNIYYGEWDDENDKISIHIIDEETD